MSSIRVPGQSAHAFQAEPRTAKVAKLPRPGNRTAQFQRKYVSPLNRAIARRSKIEVFTACLALVVLISFSEDVIPAHVSVALFCIIPISIAAWFSGLRAALLLNMLCIPIWYSAISLIGGNDPIARDLDRFVVFCFTAYVVARLRDFSDNLEQLAEKRAQDLIYEVAQRERLEREMLGISEREQRRIGEELHDGLCQQLTGTAMRSQSLVRKLTQESDKDEARKIVDLIEQSIWLARGVAKGLYPVENHREGLMQALEEFAATTSDLFAVHCQFDCQFPVLVQEPVTAGHLFRIAQEAASNAIRHGRATQIHIVLAQTESGIQLSIADNGIGLSEAVPAPNSGMGLRTMAVRTKLMGGSFALKASALGGAEVNCFVPDQVYA